MRLLRPAPLALLALVLGCSKAPDPPGEIWQSGVVYPTPSGPNARGLLDRRGLIHAHSYWSHDACDDEPIKNGVRDEACFDDFRAGVCKVQHDFVMLTDHGSDFAITTMPEAVLFRAERGDVLVERNGNPVANWAACPDGRTALILAGSETGFTPVGLEHHLADTPELRKEALGEITAEMGDTMRGAGALVLMAHTEEWTPERLMELGVDGFEMYNLHAQALRSAGTVLELIVLASDRPEELPSKPDLIFLPLFTEDLRYISTWGSVLARGYEPTTTMGSDCHQNSFPGLLPDGERGDSYRRMMSWFSNHLLVRSNADGSWDDLNLKQALDAGRLFGVFEALGYEEGFDFVAKLADGRVLEMGERVALGDAPVLNVARPNLRGLDPSRTPPDITLHLFRAMEGGFEEVAASSESLSYSPTQAGAYRAEVRMVPRHLRQDLGKFAPDVLAKDQVWIYSNAIYVR